MFFIFYWIDLFQSDSSIKTVIRWQNLTKKLHKILNFGTYSHIFYKLDAEMMLKWWLSQKNSKPILSCYGQREDGLLTRLKNFKTPFFKRDIENFIHEITHIGLEPHQLFSLLNYHKSSIRSRLCIIFDPNFPRLVLEVIQKLRENVYSRGVKGSSKNLKKTKKVKFW